MGYSKYDKHDNRVDYTDCFAYGRYRCKALTDFLCKDCGKCNFYKPKHVYLEKISKLPERYEK